MSAYKKWDLLSVRLIKLSAPKYDPPLLLAVAHAQAARFLSYLTHAQVVNVFYRIIAYYNVYSLRGIWSESSVYWV